MQTALLSIREKKPLRSKSRPRSSGRDDLIFCFLLPLNLPDPQSEKKSPSGPFASAAPLQLFSVRKCLPTILPEQVALNRPLCFPVSCQKKLKEKLAKINFFPHPPPSHILALCSWLLPAQMYMKHSQAPK